ncbi:BatA domain-containing protein [Planctomicrobium sp. SH668]|uniref:BatA domain-containing protein n=1 Tax=Planctomicrobium sp. SH668 TaxID=3448126 RepID=UPI003F5B1C1D
MGFGFLNAWMLIGIAGVALPVLAHLISKRRFEVVRWGAMQFLELGQKSRRRIHLQDLLLLLLRMAVLLLLAAALARPWGSGSLLGGFGNTPPQDYVFVLDGSGSMDWQGSSGDDSALGTPRQQAEQWVHSALESLQPGDAVGIVDARMSPHRVVSPPMNDRAAVRQSLNGLPESAGPSNLPGAIEDAIKILSTSTNLSRQIIVLSDDQKLAWRPDDELTWLRIDELRKQSKVFPRIDYALVGGESESKTNFSVGRIDLSRAVTVPEFPVKVRAMVRMSGGSSPTRRKAFLKVDGKQIQGKIVEVDLLPNGESLVEFNHVFASEGNYLVSISLDPDDLPLDDVANAVMTIRSSIPVLLVDGHRHLDPIRSETFYLQSVFAASGEKSPWIKASVITSSDLDGSQLEGQQGVFLCNVDQLSLRQWEILRQFVQSGGGLVVAPGDRTNIDVWNTFDANAATPLLPVRFQATGVQLSADATQSAGVDSLSLEAPWLQRFRTENGVDFTQARFQKWWDIEPRQLSESEETNAPAAKAPQVLARLSNGSPFLVGHDFGLGTVLVTAVPLDADWSTFPAKNDFVPFLHELVFQFTSRSEQRNVDQGVPLMLPLKAKENASDFLVSGPGVTDAPAEFVLRGQSAFAMFRKTAIPGVYRFHKKQSTSDVALFVVDNDHSESDLTAMSEEEWKTLTANDRLHKIKSMRDVHAATAAAAPHVELWWILMLAILALLVCEVALTRRMVQGGHAALDEALAAP